MSVFLSYSRRDVDLVNRLYDDLLAQGIQVWMDRNAIEAGSLWRTSIFDGIQACQVFLLVVSSASQQSSNVAKEVSLAESSRKPIVPLKIDDTPIQPNFGYALAGIQFIDMISKGYASSLAEILDAIQRLSYSLDPALPRFAVPEAAAPHAAGLTVQPDVMAESAALRSATASASPPPASASQSPVIAPGDQESGTLISQETLARMHQAVAEELGPIVQLIWSEQFAQGLLIESETIVARLMSLGVPEDTALRLRKRLQPFL